MPCLLVKETSAELPKPAQWASIPWSWVSTALDSWHCQLVSLVLMRKRGIPAKRRCELQAYRNERVWNEIKEKNGFVMTARHLFLSIAWVSISLCDLCSAASSVSVASAFSGGRLSMVKWAFPERNNLGFTSGFGPINLPFFRGTPARHTPRKDFCNRNRVQGVSKFLPLSRQ